MASFLKDTSRVAVSKVLMIATGLATSVIVARWLGPSANGVMAAVAVYPALLMTVGSLGVRQATAFSLGSGKYQLNDIKTAISQLWLVASTITVFGSFALIWIFSKQANDLLLVSLAIAPIPFQLFNTYNTGIFLGQNKIRKFSRISWLPKLFVLLSTIVLVIFLAKGVYGALLATAMGPFVMFVILVFQNKFVQHVSLRVNWEIVRSLVGLGAIYAIAMLVLTLNYKSDIIFLEYLSDSREVGIYSKGAHLMEYLWEIPMLFSMVTFARSASTTDRAAFSRKVTKLLRLSLIVVGTISIVLGVVAKPLILLLFGEQFEGSALVLQIMLPGVVVLTILKVVNMDLAGRGKPWISIQTMLPALVINIALNFAMIPKYGANGAAFASTVSYFFGGVFTWLAYARETGQPISEILRFGAGDLEFLLSKLKKAVR